MSLAILLLLLPHRKIILIQCCKVSRFFDNVISSTEDNLPTLSLPDMKKGNKKSKSPGTTDSGDLNHNFPAISQLFLPIPPSCWSYCGRWQRNYSPSSKTAMKEEKPRLRRKCFLWDIQTDPLNTTGTRAGIENRVK